MSALPVPDVPLSDRIAEIYRDVQACAELAGLVYVGDEQPGIRRQRCGSGFTYRDSANRTLTDPAIKQRIVALAIPPAWKNVWICPDDCGHIAAIGEDDRGRRQYIYHERWRALRDLLNFYRLIGFGDQLPVVRKHVETQLRRRILDRDRVLAAMIRIVDLTAVRIGNEIYAEENDSIGLTTLNRRHVTVVGPQVRLRFPAKSGKQADLLVTDRQVARIVEHLLRQRRRRLFTVDGKAIDAPEVNCLLADLTGEHITAKDFRTWHATHTVFDHLAHHRDAPEGARDRIVLEAIDAAAQTLGNTRAVARAHYIHPRLVTSFLDGTFSELLRTSAPLQRPGLEGSERRLLAFLKAAIETDLELAAVGI